MEITIREFKHADVVTVSGRVDSSTAPKLDQTLKGLMDDKHYNIVLDLCGVEYMSSAGLRAMVSCLRRVKKGPRTAICAWPIPPSGSLRSWNWLAWTRFSRYSMIW